MYKRIFIFFYNMIHFLNSNPGNNFKCESISLDRTGDFFTA